MKTNFPSAPPAPPAPPALDALPATTNGPVRATVAKRSATGTKRSATGTKTGTALIETPRSVTVITLEQMDARAVSRCMRSSGRPAAETAARPRSTSAGSPRFLCFK